MTRILTRAFLVWLLMMAAESIHGMLRKLCLVPLVGDLHARQIGAIAGSAIVLTLAYLCIQWIGVKSAHVLWPVGLMWLILTLCFEFVLGRYAFGYSWQRILADYDFRKGGLLLFGMGILGLAPWIASALRIARHAFVGGVAIIDAATEAHVVKDLKGSGGHSESFQLENKGPRVFVNVLDDRNVNVIDRKTGALAKWELN